jgi:hypothetical protein
MAISLPSKRFWIFAIVLVAIVVVGLWWLGRSESAPIDEGSIITARELTPEEKILNVQTLIIDRLSTARGLEEFDPANIPTDDAKVNTQTTENRESVSTYAALMTQALASYNQKQTNEAKIMVDALDTRDQTKALSLLSARTMYQGMVVKLESISVPESALAIHKLMITSLKQMIYLLEPMSQILDEPVLALQASEAYLEANTQFFLTLNALNQYFRDQNLQFSDDNQIKATF